MWAKSVLLSALLAASAYAAPANVRVEQAAAFPPSLLIQVQDRGQDIRPLREVVAELRAQYGGEYVSHRLEQGGSPVYVVRWRMPDGQIRDIRVSASR